MNTDDERELMSFLEAALYLVRETGQQLIEAGVAYEQTETGNDLITLIKSAGMKIVEVAEGFAKDAGIDLSKFGEDEDEI